MSEHKSTTNRGMGGGGHGSMGGTEKAKDFKKTIGKLMNYIGRYKVNLVIVAIFAIGSTMFSIIGPTILGNATTEIFKGLLSKLSGGEGIDFQVIGRILLTLTILYLISALFSFIQGYIMSGVTQKITYRLRKELTQKINNMPMNYFDTKTHGDVLSRVTNDVDTMGQSLNQSVTQIITSFATIIGVLIMMLRISVTMTLVALGILPFSMILISIIMKKSQKHFATQQEYLGKINGQVEEVYGGHTIVSAFNKEESVITEFEETNHVLYESAWKSQFLSG
ncbi:MAG: ABC transporter ATP-binding protein, partial [Clostridiales bacterium]|nr:ABC transporter ATP-binding protein [Clostridiales bacterium]